MAFVASVIGDVAVAKLKLPDFASKLPFPVAIIEFPEFFPDELRCPGVLHERALLAAMMSFECRAFESE